MGLFKKFLISFFAAILSLFLADSLLEGVKIQTSSQQIFSKYWQVLFFLGFWLAFFNFFAKPILKRIFFPLTLLTFGIFSVILNIAIFFAFDSIFQEIEIENLFSLIITTMISSFTNWLLTLLL